MSMTAAGIDGREFESAVARVREGGAMTVRVDGRGEDQH